MRRILREFPKLIHSWYGSVWKRPVHVFNLLLNIKPARIMQTSLAGSDSSKLNSTLNGSNDRRQLTRAENRAYLATNHLVLSFRAPFPCFPLVFLSKSMEFFLAIWRLCFFGLRFKISMIGKISIFTKEKNSVALLKTVAVWGEERARRQEIREENSLE